MKTLVTAAELRTGSELYFAKFYKEYYPLFMSFACKFLPEREAARDVVQDVFIDYLKCRDSFQEMVQIKVFFFRNIRNKSLNIINHNKIHEKFVGTQIQKGIETTEFFHSTILREEIAFAIHREIEKLPPAAKQVLLLALEGKSNEEIATELSISVNTVKTHKARSYPLLRQKLTQLLSLLVFLKFI